MTAVCRFDVVDQPTPAQERDIPKLLETTLTEAVNGCPTRSSGQLALMLKLGVMMISPPVAPGNKPGKLVHWAWKAPSA